MVQVLVGGGLDDRGVVSVHQVSREAFETEPVVGSQNGVWLVELKRMSTFKNIDRAMVAGMVRW